jgi:hypothetical protein
MRTSVFLIMIVTVMSRRSFWHRVHSAIVDVAELLQVVREM